ncbi:MAG TPA: DNA-binding response regulator [Clostridiales bacterium]|nr:DNA-binding response regulator [Clostridiales bacterium]HBL83092.1 DNA-binding response regulator [Clostridiales bacterium]
MNNAILLIEDDDSLRRGICVKLKKEGYDVLCAETLAAANALFSANRVSLIICDIGLPDGSGLDFCREVRRESNVMFLFLTAQDTEIDMVNGYEAGADDYITKPFPLMVLISKVNAIMRRTKPEEKFVICSGDIMFDLKQNRAKRSGAYLALTANEQKLLLLFLKNPMQILSKNQLLESLWDSGGNFVDENTLAVNIRCLREKIETDPSHPVYIKNIRGLGYIWERACETK